MTEDGSKARGIIAIIVAVNFFAVIMILVFAKPDPSVKEYFVLLIGALITAQATVLGFYFGSSSGAKQLVANQNEIVKAAAAPVAAAAAAGNALSDAKPAGTQKDPVVTVDAAEAPASPAKGAVPLSVQIAQAESEPGFLAFRRALKALNPDILPAEVLAQWRSSDNDIDQGAAS